MLEYLGIIIFILFWNYLFNNTKIKKTTKDNIIVYGFAFAFILLFSLRSSTMGIDLQVYIPAFFSINELSWNVVFTHPFQNFEQGFIILNKLIGSIYLNEQFFLFVCALITILPVFYMIRNYSCNYILSTFIWMSSYFFVMTFSALRQVIAISICFYAMSFLLKKQYLSYVIVIMFACFFHSSALICLISGLAYWLGMEKKDSIVYLIGMGFILLITIIFKHQILEMIINILQLDSIKEYTANGYGLMFILYLLIGMFVFFVMDFNNAINRGLLNIYTLAIICQSFGTIHALVGRITCYFFLPTILLMTYIFNNNDRDIVLDINNTISRKNYYKRIFNKRIIVLKNKKIFAVIISVCFVLLYFYMIQTTSWAMAVPYIPFWEII